MYIWKLALRNLINGGLRTWLNAFILSVSFVLVIGCQGLYKGMNNQMERSSIDNFYGGGQYWCEQYDPYDTLMLDEAHSRIPPELQKMVNEGQAAPLLLRQATLYASNRIITAVLNGLPENQTILNIPIQLGDNGGSGIPVLLGERMAKSAGLNLGDTATIRWRDANGTFDAAEIYLAGIMQTNMAAIDQGQIWLALDTLQTMTELHGESTMVILAQNSAVIPATDGWKFQDLNALLSDIHEMIVMQYIEGGIAYAIFLFLAMLGIFDTQILAIFRRIKEMGTMLALGITKSDLIKIFTLEGALNAVFATLLAVLYGTPLLIWFARVGFTVPSSGELGFALDDCIYPVYTPAIIFGTAILIFALTTLVSYIPCRRISKLTPTEALRGKAK